MFKAGIQVDPKLRRQLARFAVTTRNISSRSCDAAQVQSVKIHSESFDLAQDERRETIIGVRFRIIDRRWRGEMLWVGGSTKGVAASRRPEKQVRISDCWGFEGMRLPAKIRDFTYITRVTSRPAL